jgi:hypothetical protein
MDLGQGAPLPKRAIVSLTRQSNHCSQRIRSCYSFSDKMLGP